MSTLELEPVGNMEKDPMEKKFEEFMEGIQEGYTVLVYRESPKHLAGFLETLDLSETENPFDIKYLSETWGGEVIKLILRDKSGKWRNNALIPLRSYPPKMNGKIIGKEEDSKDELEKLNKYASIIKNLQPSQSATVPSTDQNMMSIMMPLMMQLFERVLSVPSVPTPTVQISEVLNALSSVKEFVKDSDTSDPPWLGAVSKVGEILASKYMESQAQIARLPPQQQAQIARLPPQQRQQLQPQLQQIPRPQPIQNPVPIPEDLPADIMNQISGEQATKFFLDTLDKMPETKREEALKVLFKELDIVDDEPASIHTNENTDNGRTGSD